MDIEGWGRRVEFKNLIFPQTQFITFRRITPCHGNQLPEKWDMIYGFRAAIFQGAVCSPISLIPGPYGHITEGRKGMNTSDQRCSLAKSSWGQGVNLSHLIPVVVSYWSVLFSFYRTGASLQSSSSVAFKGFLLICETIVSVCIMSFGDTLCFWVMFCI